MADQITASIYDYPRYYDLLFGSDWKAEYDFMLACFQKHADRKVKRIFEPACGTGRLLVKLADAGFDVAGNDLNPKAIRYCNERLARHGHPKSTTVEDMADFKVKKKFDAAFNMINTFRHLPTEKLAQAHLECMAKALNKGGLYLLGLHLEPTACDAMEDEAWTARRGNLVVNSYMWSKGVDRKTRLEHLGMQIDVYTPSKHIRIMDHMEYRTYRRSQFTALLNKVPELFVEETYDFAYDINKPHRLNGFSEDVVYVLKRV
ncbi:MAG: class I SAM-dependent methyltransferase [Planctomycetaceae bacterium]|nr:class I SAM-dependent methyltransferase [Planctomycetaceae bacterium]